MSHAGEGDRASATSSLDQLLSLKEAGNPSKNNEKILLSSIIGCHQRANQITVFHCPLKNGKRRRRQAVFPLDGEGAARQARENVLRAIAWRARRVLVIVNPFGGAKMASIYLETVVEPMFFEAGISYDVVTTEYSGHAEKIAAHFDPAKFDGIVTISGDGTLHEIMNGLNSRPGLDFASVPIGVLNGGTANCVVAAILDERNERCGKPGAITNATFAFVQGRPRQMDILHISSRRAGSEREEEILLCQSISWGLIADIEFDSEWMRSVGSSRYDCYALKHIARNATYRGEIQYIPEDISQTGPDFQRYLCTRPDVADMHMNDGGSDGWRTFPCQSFSWVALMVNGFWSLSNIACPFVRLGDGLALLMLVPAPVSRRRLLRIFLSLETGRHAWFKSVTWLAVREARFSFPTDTRLNFDGEQFLYSETHCRLAPVKASIVY